MKKHTIKQQQKKLTDKKTQNTSANYKVLSKHHNKSRGQNVTRQGGRQHHKAILTLWQVKDSQISFL